MKSLEHYAITRPTKARFKIKLDTSTWDLMQRTAPTLDAAFELFPDLEAIEIDFIKPAIGADISYLSGVPRAWIRLNGEVEPYTPDDDAYGLASYLLQIGEQLSPLHLSLLPAFQEATEGQQRFNLTFSASACLIRDPETFELMQGDWDTSDQEELFVLEGFTSKDNPGGYKSHRLNAQMSVICEILSKQLDMDVELDKVHGARSKGR